MCSDPRRPRTVAACAFAALLVGGLPAQVITETEALALAFPGAELRREEIELTDTQREAVQQASGATVVPRRVVRHVATKGGIVIGVAWVDVRKVRTHTQTLLVVIDAKSVVRRVELLAFDEPKRYRPRPEFYAQFAGRTLDDELRLRRGIRPIAGATLSAAATVTAVRTALALQSVLPTSR